MKYKAKDIITVTVCILIIAVSVYFLYNFLTAGNSSSAKKEEDSKKTFITLPETIDEKSYEKVNGLIDYGKPNLDNIGRSDPFAPINN